ncbi:MAG: transferase family-domain-containing protein [Piptocephalis tieghemiana]|nr:MAG: transferase family-domain-containing protein [Piptocephalis tieghemiana]
MDGPIDVLGQQSALKGLYTQLCLCFPVADASSHTAIISTLRNGLERLSENFPWVAGNVTDARIEALEKTPRLIVKDLRDDPSVPTMDVLRRANFPFSMLDENIIAPRKTLPDGSASDSPVFLLQVNFITSGLLLTFNGEHQAMDMIGQGQIISLLSKACHNEGFTSEELSSANLPRRNLVPLLDDCYKPGPEIDHQIVKPRSNHPDNNPPPCTWAYFTFDPTSLATLKAIATKNLHSDYISSDDAISAFIWQSVTRARLPRLNPTDKSIFARAVDVRRYLDIPPTYPGIVQNMTYHTYTLQKLIEEPVGSVASQLRLAVDPKTSKLGYNTRALATALSRASDKSTVSVTATLDLSSDIMFSSWAKVNSYHLDFNLGLGKPEAVRRPLFNPVESLIYLMPKRLDGEIAVAICLRDEDMERLRADEEFAKYANYIG